MIIIERAENGFILIVANDEEDTEKYVFDVEASGEHEAIVNMLYTITSHLGHYGSKHDAKRIYIKVAPGENHSDFKDEHDILIG